MINIPQSVLNQIDLNNVAIFNLVGIRKAPAGVVPPPLLGSSSLYYRYTTLPYDVTYDGEVYIGDDTLIEVNIPESNSEIGRNEYTISMSKPVFPLVDFFTNIQGRSVEIYVGFIDNSGKPILSTNSLIKLDKAVIDTPSRTIETEDNGRDVFILTCCTPLLDLDAKKPIYTSQDAVTKSNPGDTSFEQVFEGSGQIAIKWGKS